MSNTTSKPEASPVSVVEPGSTAGQTVLKGMRGNSSLFSVSNAINMVLAGSFSQLLSEGDDVGKIKCHLLLGEGGVGKTAQSVSRIASPVAAHLSATTGKDWKVVVQRPDTQDSEITPETVLVVNLSLGDQSSSFFSGLQTITGDELQPDSVFAVPRQFKQALKAGRVVYIFDEVNRLYEMGALFSLLQGRYADTALNPRSIVMCTANPTHNIVIPPQLVDRVSVWWVAQTMVEFEQALKNGVYYHPFIVHAIRNNPHLVNDNIQPSSSYGHGVSLRGLEEASISIASSEAAIRAGIIKATGAPTLSTADIEAIIDDPRLLMKTQDEPSYLSFPDLVYEQAASRLSVKAAEAIRDSAKTYGTVRQDLIVFLTKGLQGLQTTKRSTLMGHINNAATSQQGLMSLEGQMYVHFFATSAAAQLFVLPRPDLQRQRLAELVSLIRHPQLKIDNARRSEITFAIAGMAKSHGASAVQLWDDVIRGSVALDFQGENSEVRHLHELEQVISDVGISMGP